MSRQRATLRLLLSILAIAVPSAARSQLATPSPVDSAHLVSRLSHLADSLARHDALSGVILLAKDGRPIFERAYGLAERSARRANTVGTSFNLSSIGKRFTQVAVAQLAASGKLGLDSTIASVWPDYPNPDIARRVTIRQLLEHRSGIGGNIFANPTKSRTNADYLPLFVHDTLHFAPGTREEYSNAGYIVLGEIVARASGERYDAYVQRHVFEPASMRKSGYFRRDSLPLFAAVGYTRQSQSGPPAPSDAPLVSAAAEQPLRGSAAGGAYASAGDLLNFILAFRAGSLGAHDDLQRSIIAGGSPGSNGIVAEGLPGGYDLIVLENLDPPAADAILAPVMSWLGVPPPSPGRRMAAGAPAQRIVTAATTLPDTPVGHVAAEYLRAYNSGDPEAMRRFFVERAVNDPGRPTAGRVDSYKRIYGDNGSFELTSVGAGTPSSLTLSVQAAKGQALTITFILEAGSNRLKSLSVNMDR